VEKITNHLHNHLAILVVTQIQTLVTMTMMTIKKETMAGAEEADIRNTMLKGDRFLETHLPTQEGY